MSKIIFVLMNVLGFVAGFAGLGIALYYGAYEVAPVFGILLLCLAFATAMAKQWREDPFAQPEQ